MKRKFSLLDLWENLNDTPIIRDKVNKLLEEDKIEKSMSPHHAPVILVSKPDGDLRFCIDYRSWNLNTLKEQFPIPNTEDFFSSLSEAWVFSKID